MKKSFLVMLLQLSTVVTTAVVKVEIRNPWSDAAGYSECPEWVTPNKTLPKPIRDICGVHVECPKSVKIANSDCGYGTRRLLSGKWVTTKVVKNDYYKAYFRLFDYTSGGNADQAILPVTSPLVTKSSPNPDENSMHLYISDLYQASPPTPTNHEVYIESWDERVMYYRALGREGASIPPDVWTEELSRLVTAVQRAGGALSLNESVVAAFVEPGVSVTGRYEIIYFSE
ncbi:hypothetical protein ACHWQZ_G002391 [Mnemiopsis leidyi]